MAQAGRARQMADRIKVVVAETLERRIKDPRLGFVTVTDVRITGDLHDATIFYTVLGDEEARAGTRAALESAKGVLRSEVGRQLGVRFTPTLAFMEDALPETSHHIEDLLRAAKESDEQLAAAREGATYAGDADPYRVPREDDDDPEEDGPDAADDADTDDTEGADAAEDEDPRSP